MKLKTYFQLGSISAVEEVEGTLEEVLAYAKSPVKWRLCNDPFHADENDRVTEQRGYDA